MPTLSLLLLLLHPSLSLRPTPLPPGAALALTPLLPDSPSPVSVTIQCQNLKQVSLFLENSKKVCGIELKGSASQINKKISEIRVKREGPEAFLELFFHVKTARNAPEKIFTQTFFAPRKIVFSNKIEKISLNQINEKKPIFTLDPECVTPQSEFTIRPIGNLPSSIHFFIEKNVVFVYAKEKMLGKSRVNLSIELIEKNWKISTGIVNFSLRISPNLLANPEFVGVPLEISVALSLIFFLFVILFFILKTESDSQESQTVFEFGEKSSKSTENSIVLMRKTIEQWNRKRANEILNDKQLNSATRSSLNVSEIKDATLSRSSILDLSRNAPELDLEY